MIDFTSITPREARLLYRENKVIEPTSGVCPGYAQCNLIILPQELAADFKKFAELNPFSCPVLEVSEPGSRKLHRICDDVDLATDFPKYRVYRNGALTEEPADVKHLWRDDLVCFLIGCSFSFEDALIKAGIPIRHNEEHCNVPMYKTNIACTPAGAFSGNTVVSMRPMTPAQAKLATDITAAMPRVHGAPVHVGDPSVIGIQDVNHPDFGDAVTIREGEVPVFWPCGVTPQSVVMNIKPPFAITHAPGHMLVCDILNEALK